MTNKKVFTATLLGAFIILVIAAVLIIHANQNKNVQKRLSEYYDNRREMSVSRRGEDYLSSNVASVLRKESEACDRLQLPQPERARRMNAIFKAAEAETERVRASHYTVAYQAPVTD